MQINLRIAQTLLKVNEVLMPNLVVLLMIRPSKQMVQK